MIATSLIIPDQSGTKLNVLSADYTEYFNVLIAPSKGNLLRTEDPSLIPYEFGAVYELDEFYPGELAYLPPC